MSDYPQNILEIFFGLEYDDIFNISYYLQFRVLSDFHGLKISHTDGKIPIKATKQKLYVDTKLQFETKLKAKQNQIHKKI